MGNAHTSGKGPLDYTPSMVKGYPMQFHESHSTNVKLSADKCTARRIESFCKGICFGSRPVAPNERVYIRFAEISTSWSGVLRFGFTAVDPVNINTAELPRYACPDLTNKPGFWAKALPERMAEEGNILFFYLTRNGDCIFGLNNKEKGVFFSGVDINNFLYPLVDIYGNTIAMEFVDGLQISSEGSYSQVSSKLDKKTISPHPPGIVVGAGNPPPPVQQQQFTPPPPSHPMVGGPLLHARSVPTLPSASGMGLAQLPATPVGTPHPPPHHTGGSLHSSPAATGPPLHYASFHFTPLPLHATVGRNIQLSPDRTVAVRLKEEYCNGYVFSSRPLQCGERIVIQILSIDRTYVGGLAFGVTACDPTDIPAAELPDDSDLLLDRPEYWIVNKDVYSNPETGDELSFHLNIEGQVVYSRNGHTIATLMHIDKTLPMWPFFDVYGTTQKIKCLGVGTSTGNTASSSSHLQVTLPPSRNQSTSSLALTTTTNVSPLPPRPPPPRTSPGGSMKHSPRGSPSSVHRNSPPSLPPKQNRPLPTTPSLVQQSQVSPPPPAPPAPPMVVGKPPTHGLSLPPPLIPVPVGQLPGSSHPSSPNSTTPQDSTAQTPTVITTGNSPITTGNPKVTTPQPQTPTSPTIPPIPPRQIDKWTRATPAANIVKAAALPCGDQSQEALDNASNECCVCLENQPNCVLYTCGHMCMCFDCAASIRKSQKALCPICCQEIKDVIKIFRS